MKAAILKRKKHIEGLDLRVFKQNVGDRRLGEVKFKQMDEAFKDKNDDEIKSIINQLRKKPPEPQP
jgi:hypothetical protein